MRLRIKAALIGSSNHLRIYFSTMLSRLSTSHVLIMSAIVKWRRRRNFREEKAVVKQKFILWMANIFFCFVFGK